MNVDLILSGGTVVDGTNALRFRADVGIADGRIAAIGDLSATSAGDRIDVTGRVVAPGFVDIHSHSDMTLFACPAGDSKIRQGVTTEVIGNCGLSPAPLGDRSDLVRPFFGTRGTWVNELPWNWSRYGDYADALDSQQISVNVVPIVGHMTIRAVGMGMERRPPTTEELERMQTLLREALEDGCFAFSTGLILPPSSYADTEELVTLARVLKDYGAIYFSHIRGEGDTLIRATSEAIEIGERAGVPVQIAHHKATQRQNWGRIRQAIQLSVWSNERGNYVTFDVYPYTAGSGGIIYQLPQWTHAGGRKAMLDRLQDPATRMRVIDEVNQEGKDWEQIFVSWMPEGPGKQHEGQSLAEIAERRGIAPTEALLAMTLESNGDGMIVGFSMSEDDVRYVMSHPLAMIGSDGMVLTPEGVLGQGKPHPRSYGCYPRVFGKYVREEGALTLEEAVHKCSYRPAEKLGLKRKGRIQVGADADIAVFDPATVIDTATFKDPHQFPIGIEHVLVAGKPTVRNGEHTGVRAGRVLRRSDGS